MPKTNEISNSYKFNAKPQLLINSRFVIRIKKQYMAAAVVFLTQAITSHRFITQLRTQAL